MRVTTGTFDVCRDKRQGKKIKISRSCKEKKRKKKKECKYKWRRQKVPGHGFPHSDLLTLLSPK